VPSQSWLCQMNHPKRRCPYSIPNYNIGLYQSLLFMSRTFELVFSAVVIFSFSMIMCTKPLAGSKNQRSVKYPHRICFESSKHGFHEIQLAEPLWVHALIKAEKNSFKPKEIFTIKNLYLYQLVPSSLRHAYKDYTHRPIQNALIS
jgi:hypothetical protein